MTIDATSNRYFYLRAEFKFGIWDGLAAPSAFYGPVNFTKLEITAPKQKMTRLMSNMESSYGNLLDAQPSVSDPATLNCEFDSMTSGLLNMLIGSASSDLTQASGAIATENVTPVLGVWKKFSNRFIDPDVAVVFKNVTPAVIASSNFEVDYINGMYRAITSTGASAVTVSYSKASRSAEVYDAGLAINKYVMLVGTATELSSAKRCSLAVHKANLMASGKIDLVGQAYLKGALDGDMLIPSGYNSPWRFEYLDLAA